MKNVLTMTAVIEGGAGVLLMAVPSLAATLLFGSRESPFRLSL